MTNHQRWFRSEAAGILRRRRLLQLMFIGAVTRTMPPVQKEELSPTKIWTDEQVEGEFLIRGGNRRGMTDTHAVEIARIICKRD